MPDMAEEKLDQIQKTIANLPGYVFELTANLGSERNFSIRGNFPIGASLEAMNVELDKLVEATNRQLSRSCILPMEEDLAKQRDQLASFQRNVELIKKKGKTYKQLPAQAEAELEGAMANVEVQKALIARKEKFLEKTRKDAE